MFDKVEQDVVDAAFIGSVSQSKVDDLLRTYNGDLLDAIKTYEYINPLRDLLDVDRIVKVAILACLRNIGRHWTQLVSL